MNAPKNSAPDPHADPLVASVMRAAGAVPARDCPEAEVLALYAEQELSSDERGLVEAHVVDCGRCQATLAAFVRSAPEAGGPEGAGNAEGHPWWAGWRWMVPLASATAVLAVAVWIGRRPVEQPAPATAPVAEVTASAPSLAADTPASAAAREPLIEAKRRDVPETAAKPVASGGAIAPSPGPSTRELARANEPAPSSSGQVAMADRLEARAGTAEALMLQRERQEAAAPSAQAPPPPAATARAASADSASSSRADGGRAAPAAVDAGANAATSGASNALGMTASKAAQPLVWRVRDGVVERSVDQGATWARTTSPTSARLTAVSSTDARNAVVTTSAGVRFATSDGGATWRRLP